MRSTHTCSSTADIQNGLQETTDIIQKSFTEQLHASDAFILKIFKLLREHIQESDQVTLPWEKLKPSSLFSVTSFDKSLFDYLKEFAKFCPPSVYVGMMMIVSQYKQTFFINDYNAHRCVAAALFISYNLLNDYVALINDFANLAKISKKELIAHQIEILERLNWNVFIFEPQYTQAFNSIESVSLMTPIKRKREASPPRMAFFTQNYTAKSFSKREQIVNLIHEFSTSDFIDHTICAMLASSELHEKDQFKTFYKKLKTQIIEKDINAIMGKHIWSYILFSARRIGETDIASEAKKEIVTFINEPLDYETTIATLGRVYINYAMSGKEEYEYIKTKLEPLVTRLTRQYYFDQHTSRPRGTPITFLLLLLLSAAHAGDRNYYFRIKCAIQDVARCGSVQSAINEYLLKEKNYNDYYTYALSIACYAAALIADKELHNETYSLLSVHISSPEFMQNKVLLVYTLVYHDLAVCAYTPQPEETHLATEPTRNIALKTNTCF